MRRLDALQLLSVLAVAAAVGPLIAADGAALLQRHCALCHARPEPDLLAAEDWPGVTAWMGRYLGLPARHPDRDQAPVAAGLVNATTGLDREGLAAITAHLQAGAPSLAARRRHLQASLPAASATLAGYTPLVPEALQVEAGVVTLLAWRQGGLFVGTGLPAALHCLAPAGRTGQLLPSEPIALHAAGDRQLVALMGNLGGDRRAGGLWSLPAVGQPRVISTGHHRLAGMACGDLDGDGRLDAVLVGFGDLPHGELTIVWSCTTPSPEVEVLRRACGAVSALIEDVDGDGRDDLLVCWAHLRPRIEWFRQQEPRRFASRVLLERPIGWGYNHLRVYEHTAAGRPVLLSLAGNNMELPQRPLKACHGARLLDLVGEDQDLRLVERCHLPLPGAALAAVVDCEGDGDRDLILTALFPDWLGGDPLTAVAALRRGPDRFDLRRLPGLPTGRWLTVAAGDLEGDGDTDILLGGAPALPLDTRAIDQWGEAVQASPRVWMLRRD